MSAVSNITYVCVLDQSAAAAIESFGLTPFSNYDEAMSFAKWLSLSIPVPGAQAVYVWNYNGGSGLWSNGVFTSRANANWP